MKPLGDEKTISDSIASGRKILELWRKKLE
jgi:hypothetical protein